MNNLVEVRGPNHGFEMRNGAPVEFPDVESRLAALGCPETILKRIRTRSLRPTNRSAAPHRRAPQDSPVVLQAASDAARRSAAVVAGRKIAQQTDADLRSRSARLGAQIAEDEAQEKRHKEMRARAETSEESLLAAGTEHDLRFGPKRCCTVRHHAVVLDCVGCVPGR